MGEENRPNFAKGCLWGVVVSIPLWLALAALLRWLL